MKKITNLLIVCSLALAGAVMAQQPQPEESPSKKQSPEKKRPAEVRPGPTHAPKPQPPAEVRPGPTHAPKPQVPAVKEPAATHAPAATHTPAVTKPDKKTPSPRQPAAIATPAAKKPQSTTIATPAPAKTIATPPAAASVSAAPTVSQTSQTKAPVNPAAAAKKPDPQKVQQIKAQHQNFHAQPKPEQVPAVTFSASYRIQGSEQWQGPKYEVYRAYHPERHDQGWYRSHYNRVELVGGGYYYWNNGYWYPAWGYSPASEYYAYDAPIYVGHRAEPPDKVIADVQAVLQEMGYYKGEVDGLLGPLTREALTAYQSDQGLVATAVMDEPTLDSLGMG
jgi:Putative peptidoglycan binding domain